MCGFKLHGQLVNKTAPIEVRPTALH